MKKIVFLGLICAMSDLDLAKAESNVYMKAGAAVQRQKDVVSDSMEFLWQYTENGIECEVHSTVEISLNPNRSYVTWGGYLGLGINFGISDNLSVKLELGSTIMENKSESASFSSAFVFWVKHEEDYQFMFDSKIKGSNSIPRMFTAINVNVLKDISAYVGVGIARLSNEAFTFAHDINSRFVVTNIRYSPMFIVGAEKRFENFDVFAEVSYIQPSTRTLDEVMIKRENNWNCILGVTIPLADF